MSTLQMKSVRLDLFAAFLGGTVLVGIVLSIPIVAILLSPGGLRGAVSVLMVTAPFGLVFVAGAAVALGLLRLSLSPERDRGASGAAKYRYEIAVGCVGALALPLFVYVASEQNPWALGSLPLGAVAGWVAATVQKRSLRVEPRASLSLSPTDDG